jgi:hypothetical protein
MKYFNTFLNSTPHFDSLVFMSRLYHLPEVDKQLNSKTPDCVKTADQAFYRKKVVEWVTPN